MTEAQQSLFDRHRGNAHAAAIVFARRWPHLRDELFAAADRGLWMACEKFTPERISERTGKPIAFKTFLYSCIRRSILESIRRETRLAGRCQSLPDDESHPAHPQHHSGPGSDGPLWGVLSFDEIAAVLPPRLAEVIALRFKHQMNFREIGSRIGVSKQRVLQLQEEALAILRRSLSAQHDNTDQT